MYVPNGLKGCFNGGIPVIALAAITLLTSQKMEEPVASMERYSYLFCIIVSKVASPSCPSGDSYG
jgi:hypothetical protein